MLICIYAIYVGNVVKVSPLLIKTTLIHINIRKYNGINILFNTKINNKSPI